MFNDRYSSIVIKISNLFEVDFFCYASFSYRFTFESAATPSSSFAMGYLCSGERAARSGGPPGAAVGALLWGARPADPRAHHRGGRRQARCTAGVVPRALTRPDRMEAKQGVCRPGISSLVDSISVPSMTWIPNLRLGGCIVVLLWLLVLRLAGSALSILI